MPLDPSYPRERLQFMIEDAKLAVILTREELSATDYTDQNHGSNPDLICGFDPRHHVTSFTSGSTGKPKGVMVTHRNVARLLAATHDWFKFDEHDTWTLFHSYAFDFSLGKGALLSGGRLVVVPYWVSRSLEDFYALLVRERVTVLNQTPSAFRQLSRIDAAQDGAEPLSLRAVIFGGEALEPASLRGWMQRHGDVQPRLINMYGITETTVHVTYRPLTLSDANTVTGSVIGEPLPDLQLCLIKIWNLCRSESAVRCTSAAPAGAAI